MISADCLRYDLVTHVLDNDATGVAYVNAEQLLAKCHDADTGASREADIHNAAEEFLVAVEECVVEGDANLIRVQVLIVLLLEQVLVILLEHVAHLRFNELGQTLLHVAGNFATVLTVPISHSEKVAVLETAEVWHRDPGVLILLVGVRG